MAAFVDDGTAGGEVGLGKRKAVTGCIRGVFKGTYSRFIN
jgi:hypothetical protein